jgi:hypothetical protein
LMLWTTGSLYPSVHGRALWSTLWSTFGRAFSHALRRTFLGSAPCGLGAALGRAFAATLGHASPWLALGSGLHVLSRGG